MTNEIKKQFKQFVENHISNPFVEEKLFVNYEKLSEYDYIFLTVETGNKRFLFESSCYFITIEGTPSYEFLFYKEESI